MIAWALYMQLLMALSPQLGETSVFTSNDGRKWLDFKIALTFPGVMYRIEESANGIHWGTLKGQYWGTGRPATVRVPIESNAMFFRMTWEMPNLLSKVQEDSEK